MWLQRVTSLYLSTDHPMIGFFDANLFIASLTTNEGEHYSALLVDSLYCACVSL